MSIDKETEIRYNQIVGTIMQNVISECGLAGDKIVLWDFHEDQPYDRLYFNAAAIVANWKKKRMYVQMPFINYVRFKWKRRKTHKNLRWCSPLMAHTLPNDAKTSIYLIIDFVREYYGETYDTFEKINNEFYGWVE